MARKREERVKLEKGAYKRAFKVFRYIKPYSGMMWIGMVFLLLSSVTTMGFPYLLPELLSSSQEGGSNSLINFENTSEVLIFLLGIFIANAVFSFFRIYTFTWVAENSIANIRKEAFSVLSLSKVSFFDKNQVGELSSRVATDVTFLEELLVTNFAEFVRQCITIIISLGVIAMISPKFLGIMMSIVPVVVIIVVFFGRYVRKLSKGKQDAVAESNSILSTALTGIKNVKSFGNEFFELRNYGTTTDTVKKLGIKGAIARGLFASFIILGLFGAITLVIYFGSNMMANKELSQTDFFRIILLTAFLAASFGGLGSLMGSIQKAVGATERLMDLLENEKESISSKQDLTVKLDGAVSFSNVGFKYETREDVTVLDDVSFNVNPGQTVAIVGPSGAGKSTITSLLLRFYENYEGSIAFDGKDSFDYDLSEIRGNMAIVPQEVLLFAGTIYDNIAYGNPEASKEEILSAAERANAVEFIEKFPDGMKTLVGDRGIQLSGGQKQRIAIARAILKNPSILILDEATSSLDSESEKLVQDALDKLMENRTSIVIAHRLSTIKNADSILVLEKGKLVEQGTHNELISRDGVYTKLNQLQFGN